jgi:hypothetical protein
MLFFVKVTKVHIQSVFRKLNYCKGSVNGSVDLRVIFTKKRVIEEKETVIEEKTTVDDVNKYTKGKGKGKGKGK